MKMRLVGAGAILLLLAVRPASAHRLDEYLQATTISVEKDRVRAEIRLTPGVAVFTTVLANIDTNSDGIISEAEQLAYAERVLGDLSLTIDGDRLPVRLVSLKYPKADEMKEGVGEIQLEFQAEAPRGGPNRRLIFENHHQAQIAAYLVNCLIPNDPDIRVTAQKRNYQQSLYQLDYVQDDVRSGPRAFGWWSSSWAWPVAAAFFLLACLALWLRARAANERKKLVTNRAQHDMI
jgi:hypothetical protein